MLVIVVPVFAGTLFASATVHAADANPQQLFATLQRWIAAVNEHRPGVRDAAAERIGVWKNRELDALAPFLETFFDLLRDPGNPDAWNRKEIDKVLIERIRQLARGELARGDANRILKRGALLHADVMMSGSARTPVRLDAGAARREILSGARIAVIGLDGQHEGFAVIPPHWPFARSLLDRVRPDPAGDDFVRLWYRATSAYLLQTSQWGDAERHLRHARERLTPDANVHLDSGCLYEAYANPRAQTMMAAARGRGAKPDVGPVDENLHRAEMHYKQALVLEPKLIEARVRLARVRIALGRADESVSDLEAASTAATDPVVRYYAVLFLGQAQDAMGRLDSARTAYRRAAALYPMSQAPHMALSVLAREEGDRETARAALWNFLRAPAPDRIRYDPWWVYYMGSGRNLRPLASKLWAAVPRVEQP